MLRSFIPAKLLPKAFSVNQARDSVMEFAGAPAGGALMELGKSIPFLGNALLNVLAFFSALCLRAQVFDPVKKDHNSRPRSWSVGNLFEGYGLLIAVPLMRAVVFSGNLIVAVFNACLTVTIWEVVRVEGSPLIGSTVSSVVAVGVFLGALVASAIVERVWGGLVALVAFVLPFLSVLGMLLTDNTIIRIALWLPSMFLLPAGSAVLGSIQMLVVAKDVLGRMFAGIGIIELVFSAAAVASVSRIYQHYGYNATMGVCAGVIGVLLIRICLTRQIRAIPKADQYEEYVARYFPDAVASDTTINEGTAH